MARGVAALIVSNTTISAARPASRSHAGETGGLSGAPLRDLAQQRLRDFRKASGGKLGLIGVGGIASAEDAYARIRAGASLVQIYSALVYHGPGLALKRINRQLRGFCSATGLPISRTPWGLTRKSGLGKALLRGFFTGLGIGHMKKLSFAISALVLAAQPVFAENVGVTSSADPRVTEAGMEMLRQGGSAADAAMAMMLALTVVEPQSSGIGGGGFLLYQDKLLAY